MNLMSTNLRFISLLLALSFVAGCDLISDNPHPSDDALKRNFESYEADFNKLVSMSNEDVKVVRVNFDSTQLENRNNSSDSVGFSKERLEEYRRLFRKLDIDYGLASSKHPAWGNGSKGYTVFLIVSGKGMVTGASEKGYAYTETEPSLIVESLDHITIDLRGKDMIPIYKRLKGNWYLFYKQGG
jgi:hypothetical protein